MNSICDKLCQNIGCFLLLLLLTACANYNSNLDRTAIEREILPLAAQGSASQIWQTEYIKVDYTISEETGTIDLSGTLYIKDRISLSFPVSEFLYFNINYLDAENRVMVSHDISPNLGYLTQMKESYTLPRVPNPPPEAVSFIFSYWGNFIGGSNSNEDTGDWEIYYSPFLQQL